MQGNLSIIQAASSLHSHQSHRCHRCARQSTYHTSRQYHPIRYPTYPQTTHWYWKSISSSSSSSPSTHQGISSFSISRQVNRSQTSSYSSALPASELSFKSDATTGPSSTLI